MTHKSNILFVINAPYAHCCNFASMYTYHISCLNQCVNVWFDISSTYLHTNCKYIFNIISAVVIEPYYKILGTKIKIHNDFDSKSILLQKGIFFSLFLKTKTLKEALLLYLQQHHPSLFNFKLNSCIDRIVL